MQAQAPKEEDRRGEKHDVENEMLVHLRPIGPFE
jgi:hypothetical protein